MASASIPAKLETVQEVCSIIAASCSAANAIASELSSAFTLFSEPPTLVRSRLHPSHSHDHRCGTFICPKCGFLAVSKASELTFPVAVCPLSILAKLPCVGFRGIIQRPRFPVGLKEQFLCHGIIWMPFSN